MGKRVRIDQQPWEHVLEESHLGPWICAVHVLQSCAWRQTRVGHRAQMGTLTTPRKLTGAGRCGEPGGAQGAQRTGQRG